MKGLNILPGLRYRPFQIITYLSFSFPELCFSRLQTFYFSLVEKPGIFNQSLVTVSQDLCKNSFTDFLQISIFHPRTLQ